MKLEQEVINQIRKAFAEMQTRQDLLSLMNGVKPLIYGEKTIPFELHQLTWYANPKLNTRRYREFKIKKKSGSERTIHAPVKGLKALQKTLSLVLQCVFVPHQAAMGFVKERSIVDNAKLHTASNYVYNIDLKDFFPSIDQARVWKCFQLTPFNLKDSSNTEIKETEDYKFQSFYKSELRGPLPKVELEKNITKYHFEGELFIEGNYRIKLINKAKVSYHLEKYLNTSNSGTITIFQKYSDLSPIIDDAKALADKVNLGSDRIMDIILGQVIAKHQFELFKKESRFRIANTIAALCCTEMDVERHETGEWIKVKRNVLPQGAPTSPVITNIVCQRLDFLLSGVAKRFGIKYSRYADDITFSSMHNVYQPESDFLKELHRIIYEQGFYIKQSKTRLQKEGYRQEVTGLLVNKKANVQKRYIKQLRMWLYYWERYGYEMAYSFFLQQYLSDKVHSIKGKPNMANVIAGKLEYFKMVKGVDSKSYIKLRERFNHLISDTTFISPEINRNNQSDVSTSINRERHLTKVIDMLLTKGLNDAMDLYKPTNS